MARPAWKGMKAGRRLLRNMPESVRKEMVDVLEDGGRR